MGAGWWCAVRDELERQCPLTIGAGASPCGDIIGLGLDLADAGSGACLDAIGHWPYFLAWNLTLAALLYTAASRAALATNIAWMDGPLSAGELSVCNDSHNATMEWK